MGPKMGKNGFIQKFSCTIGVHKQMKLAPSEAVLTKFSPFCHMYAPCCTLHTYLGAVWWSPLPHNNTMSRNEKFWVDQVTVPQPPGERQGVGNDKGGGGILANGTTAS